jgi:hypothetical protein
LLSWCCVRVTNECTCFVWNAAVVAVVVYRGGGMNFERQRNSRPEEPTHVRVMCICVICVMIRGFVPVTRILLSAKGTMILPPDYSLITLSACSVGGQHQRRVRSFIGFLAFARMMRPRPRLFILFFPPCCYSAGIASRSVVDRRGCTFCLVSLFSPCYSSAPTLWAFGAG